MDETAGDGELEGFLGSGAPILFEFNGHVYDFNLLGQRQWIGCGLGPVGGL
jgi:hypothetical protein